MNLQYSIWEDKIAFDVSHEFKIRQSWKFYKSPIKMFSEKTDFII